MKFDFTEEQKSMMEVGRDFAEKDILPTQEEDEKAHHFRKETFKKMAEWGFLGALFPKNMAAMRPGTCALLC